MRSLHLSFEPTQWQRMSDDTDVWFMEVGTGRSEWEIPEGGVEVVEKKKVVD